MVIWINGAFGAGKTTVSELLKQSLAQAQIFDPEDIGYTIQKTFPETRQLDYQDLHIWRNLVAQFILDAKKQFSAPLIIPMTLVVPAYINEIFSKLIHDDIQLFHFFLETSEKELGRRIKNQIIIESDSIKDEEVRQWRLAQIGRCCASAVHMPKKTIFLATDLNSPNQLVASIKQAIS